MTRPEASRSDTGYSLPHFLPDGRRFLFFVAGPSGENGVHLGSLDSAETRHLLESRVTAQYAGGLLFHVEGGTLFAQPFDPDAGRVSGEPAALADGVGFNEITSNAHFSASDNGVLAFSSGGEEELQPTWYDRKGNAISTVGPPGAYDHPEISPDGKRLAIDRAEASGRDVWLVDLSRGTSTRLTFDPAFDWMPAWTSGGSRVSFVSDRGGIPDLFEKSASGVGEETLVFRAEGRKHHLVSSADGRFLAFQVTSERLGFTGPRQSGGETKSDVWAMPLFGDRKAFPVLQSQFAETDPRFSPDGKWLAYASDETGRREVYVQSFPTGSGKWQISTAGGSDPRWRKDGRELFYKSGRVLMSVPVSAGASFEAGAPAVLFDTKSGAHVYAVEPTGERFLILAPTGRTAPPLTVLLHGTAKLSSK